MHLTSVLGDPAVRYRGTIGGSIANNDPAADYPAAVLALNATVKTNKRSIAADDFFKGLFSTALEEDEIITAVSFPIPAKAGYAKMRHPASRFALTAVFVARARSGEIRVAATGASQIGVMRVPAIEAALKANWSACALDSVKISADGMMGDIHGIGGLSRQSDQGDGAARSDRGWLIPQPPAGQPIMTARLATGVGRLLFTRRRHALTVRAMPRIAPRLSRRSHATHSVTRRPTPCQFARIQQPTHRCIAQYGTATIVKHQVNKHVH